MILPAVMLPDVLILPVPANIFPPVILPVPLITPVPNNTLPPVMLAVVVIRDVEFNALTTFPLKLNPAAFKLPPVMLPVADTVVALLVTNEPNVAIVTL